MPKLTVANCAHCGKEFKYFQAGGKPQIYDTNACKQKAYRARRKAVKEAQNRTLSLEAWPLHEAVLTALPRSGESVLNTFFSQYGKRAYEDMLMIVHLAARGE